MEGDLVYNVVVCIVLLKAFLRPDIPDADGMVRTSGGNAGSVGVETHAFDSAVVVFVARNHFFVGHVPQFDLAVFRARADESGVGTELHRVDPVAVRIYAEHELAIVHLEHLQSLILRAGEHQGSVCRKADCLDWGGVALDDFTVTFDRVLPNANGRVGRTRHNGVAIGRGGYTVDWAFVANKAEGTYVGFKIPDHNCAVH